MIASTDHITDYSKNMQLLLNKNKPKLLLFPNLLVWKSSALWVMKTEKQMRNLDVVQKNLVVPSIVQKFILGLTYMLLMYKYHVCWANNILKLDRDHALARGCRSKCLYTHNKKPLNNA